MEFRLRRDDDIDLVFDGELLVGLSSHDTGMSRWTEMRIYRTDKGMWVTEVVGVSTHPGESDRRAVMVHKDPANIRLGLMRRQRGEQYLTDMGRRALVEAAEADSTLQAALIERI